MLGAIIGDLAGSRFEWNSIRTKDFELLNYKCSLTDSGIMTLAVAQAVLDSDTEATLPAALSGSLRQFYRFYPRSGYSAPFSQWLTEASSAPLSGCSSEVASWISPVAYAARSMEDARSLASAVSSVTHNHPEAQKGAEAVSVAIYLALNGSPMQEISSAVKQYYPLDLNLADIRETCRSDGTCPVSVPLAFAAFLESDCFEDAIRNAVSLGSDSAAITAITGSLAEAYYGIPSDLRNRVITFLDSRQHAVISSFERRYGAIFEKNSAYCPVTSIKILPENALAGGPGIVETERPVSILSAVFPDPDKALAVHNAPSKKPVKRKTKAGKCPRKTKKKAKDESAETPVL